MALRIGRLTEQIRNRGRGHEADRVSVDRERTREPTILPTRESVFVVDDDPYMRTSIKRLLRAYGFDATLFESANALLGHGDFTGAICIVLDINLNDQSGIALRRRLSQAGV